MAESKCDHATCRCTVTEHTTSSSYCSDYCRHRGAAEAKCECGHAECAGGPKEVVK